ncbi:DNA/RNA non-specific endonuclease [Draconibacterium sediminis]|uniref:DNA/RNA non-specific endonuclease n=1 Tax=Draconibacterium sediminis TaxID=1544798 RepID=UPI0006989D08|nr:DNA/RNA non-specific endonuclease [Draconibacterium sediminis]
MILNILTLIYLATFFVAIKPAEYLPVSKGEQVVHKYFILDYNEAEEQANWVYYKLNKGMLVGEAKRTNFRMDPMVSTGSASVKDYTNSGYDRGHLCPAADMKFDDLAMYETFYMSNMTPQVPAFNRGIWKSLEEKTRNWVYEKDSLIVVVGPIFSKSQLRIGSNNVAVPIYFYKILFDEGKGKILAFKMTNEGSAQNLSSFVTTVDSIEELTGIDFFSQLPDRIEENLESSIELSNWFNMDYEYSTSLQDVRIAKSHYSIIIIAAVILFVLLFIRIKTR